MRAPSPIDLLRAYDQAAGQPPFAAARSLLALVGPGEVAGAWDALPLGRLAARLLQLHQQMFGPILELCSTCPACRQAVDFQIVIEELLSRAPAESSTPESSTPESSTPESSTIVEEHEIGELKLRFRLLTPSDLAAVDHGGARDSRRRLVERCLTTARRNGEAVAVSDLSDQEIVSLGAALEAADPLAEVRFDLVCPDCDRAWQAYLDSAVCLSQELDGAARGLLREVHTLARGYGWPEVEILAMSARRRRTYVEMLSS